MEKSAKNNALKINKASPITEHPYFSKQKWKFIDNLSGNSSFVESILLNDNSETGDDDTPIVEEFSSSKKRREYKRPRYLLKDPTAEENEKLQARIKDVLVDAAFTKHVII